jgi:hypothetical protein
MPNLFSTQVSILRDHASCVLITADKTLKCSTHWLMLNYFIKTHIKPVNSLARCGCAGDNRNISKLVDELFTMFPNSLQAQHHFP